jgi:hypothetical protein
MIAFFPFVALLALGTVCSWLGCLVPFAAISAAAAASLRTRSGAALVTIVWALNQLIGFSYHHYPHDASTYAWGVAMLVAALVAFAAARAVRARPWLAFLAAFAAFELVLVTFSIALGGWEAYAPRVLAMISIVNAVWFVVAQAATAIVLRRPLLRAVV